jgi:hypothetical protein
MWLETLWTSQQSLQPKRNSRQYGIDFGPCILVAGYYSEANIDEFLRDGVPFMIQVPSNSKLFNLKNWLLIHKR